MNEKNLITYYNKFNEDKRLTRRHGIIEYRTATKYIHEYLNTMDNPKIIDIGAGTGAYSIPLANEGYDVTAVELIKHNIEALKKYKYYAEKNGLYTCSLPKEDDKKGEGKPIATTLQKMYEISDEEFEDVINPIIPDER